MKTIAAFTLGLGLVASMSLGRTSRADDKDEKKGDAPKLAGKYELTGGKKDGTAIGDDAKKGEYSFTAEKVMIKGMGLEFVMGYKLDTKAKPIGIDMEILEGPEGSKGTKAYGIVEMKGDVLKLAYSTEKDKRPKDFDGKAGFMFEFKKKK
jgi:uncharacterized protein (TIGR03067 family)